MAVGPVATPVEGDQTGASTVTTEATTSDTPTAMPSLSEAEGFHPSEEAPATETPAEEATPTTDALPAEEAPAEITDVFYDASKVPDHLKPSFTEMQKAWTQKTQEIAPWKGLSKYGQAEEISTFLENLQTEEGALGLFLDMADKLGIPRDSLAELANKQVSTDSSVDEDEDAPMTRAEFRAWQQAQEEAKWTQEAESAKAQANREIDEAIAEFGITDPDELQAVYSYAATHPVELGHKERIRLGIEQMNAFVARKAGSKPPPAATQLPVDLEGEGARGGAAAEPPKTLEEAKKQALARSSVWS